MDECDSGDDSCRYCVTCRVFTDMEVLFVGMESIGYTILELGKITHDSSVHRSHIAHRVVLLGVGSAPLQIVCARRSL